MTFEQIMGVSLQLLSIASVLAAAAFLISKLIKGDGLPIPPKEVWFSKDSIKIMIWAASLAIGSRLALAILAWGLHQTADGQAATFEHIWSQWDGRHYLDIASHGYTADQSLGDQWLFVVFYPLYPALTALLKPLFGSYITAATAISWGCLAGACYWIYRLAALDADAAQARRAVRYLLVFPAAIFLGATYTESLFLLLTAVSLYAMRKGTFWLAGVAGLLAALARNVGVLLLLPFAVEFLDQQGVLAAPKTMFTAKFWKEFARQGLWALLIPLGFGIYLGINKIVYGDPFMFLKIQDGHWGQSMQPFYKTVLTTFQCAISGSQPLDTTIFLWIPQLIGMVALITALPALVKRLRPSYGIYLVAYVIVALSPSWLLSFNRYMMGAVPLLLAMAALTRRRWVDIVLTGVLFPLMFYLAVGYIFGYMVV